MVISASADREYEGNSFKEDINKPKQLKREVWNQRFHHSDVGKQ